MFEFKICLVIKVWESLCIERSLFEYLFDLQLYILGGVVLDRTLCTGGTRHSRKKLVIVAIDRTLVTS